ncbi:MAG: hypothetical protein ACTSYD_08155 [Candidatus Heimdallarchaeaceae archaeon]
MKIVNKAREIEAFTTKQLDNIVIEKNNDFYFIKCTFDKGKGQFEIILHKDDLKRLFFKEVKQREEEKVNQLLQEIDKKLKELEKEPEYPDPNSYVSGMEDGLLIAKSIIKKVFEGMIA